MASWYKIAGFKPPKDKDDTDTEDDNKDDDGKYPLSVSA